MLTITALSGFATASDRLYPGIAGQVRVLSTTANHLIMPTQRTVVIRQNRLVTQRYWLVPAGTERGGWLAAPEDGLHYGSLRSTNPAGAVGIRLGAESNAPLLGPFREITIHYGMTIDFIPPTDPGLMVQFPRWWGRNDDGRLLKHRVGWADLMSMLTGWPVPTTQLHVEPWPADTAQP